MDMILYNTLMGVCAGLGLILTAQAARAFYLSSYTGEITVDAGYGPAFLVLGIPLTVLSGHMAVTWPLNVNPAINIAFAEPSLMLGLLLTVAGIVIMKMTTRGTSAQNIDMRPISWIVFALGLVLASTASAIFSYNLVGDAPDLEPITGQFKGWENTAFGIVYSLAALGCLATPFSLAQNPDRKKKIIQSVVYWSWMISGITFLLFSALNYRTHIGLIINIETGTNYRW